MTDGRFRHRASVAALAVTVSLALLATYTVVPVPDPGSTLAPAASEFAYTPSTFPIKHYILIVMENHAFDNLYGVYCPSVGRYCPTAVNGLSLSVCHPYFPANPSAGCSKSFPSNNDTIDLAHNWKSSHNAYDSGKMDNFYKAEGKQVDTFAYYNSSMLPTYYDYAEQYALGENFFSSTLSYSLPNHWYIIAAQAPAISEISTLHRTAQGTLSADQITYLNESNKTTTIQDELINSTVSWRYFDETLPSSYNAALGSGGCGCSVKGAFSFWSPMLARAQTYNGSFTSNFGTRAEFTYDATHGQLPNVSWLIPEYNQSDHPPALMSQGQNFVANAIDAVESGPEWNSTAVLVTWDDYGGFYDHVTPPSLDQYGLSFREPLLVVSPYTPEGYVSNQFGYFESYLKQIEWQFGLPNITARDAEAPPLFPYFDVNATPRPPLLEPLNSLHATYPQPFQALPSPNPAVGLKAVALSNSSAYVSWNEARGGGPVAGWILTYGTEWQMKHGTHSTLRLDRTTTSIVLPLPLSGRYYTFSVRSFDGNQVSASASVTILASTTVGLTFTLQLQMRSDQGWSFDRA